MTADDVDRDDVLEALNELARNPDDQVMHELLERVGEADLVAQGLTGFAKGDADGT